MKFKIFQQINVRYFWLFFIIFIIKFGIIFFVLPEFLKILNIQQPDLFPDGYDKIALNLLEGNGYRFYQDKAETFMRPPGYIGVLTLLFYFFGKNLAVVQIVNILFSLVTAVLIILLSKKIVNLNGWIWVAPLFFLFYPGIILAETRAGVESFFALLLTAFMLSFYHAIENQRIRYFILSGSLLGLTLLVKNTPLLFPLFIFPFLFFKYQKSFPSKKIITNFMVMLITMGIVYSPWVIRNFIVSQKFIPFMTVRGMAAYQGLYINKNFLSAKDNRTLFYEASDKMNQIAVQNGFRIKKSYFPYFYHSNDEIDFDKLLFNIVTQEYKNDPILLIKSALINFVRFWYSGEVSYHYISVFLGTTLFTILGLVL